MRQSNVETEEANNAEKEDKFGFYRGGRRHGADADAGVCDLVLDYANQSTPTIGFIDCSVCVCVCVCAVWIMF